MKGIKFLSNLSDLFKGFEKSENNNTRTTVNNDSLTVTDTNPKSDMESNTTSLSLPFTAFVSYAHIDQEGMLKLRSALSPLVRQNKLKLWDDQAIDVGTTWGDEINENLTNARIVFCLVSQDFINSEFCYNKELKDALEAHKRKEKVIVPVRYRSCLWNKLPFANIQGTPNNGWIRSEQDQDVAWTKVAESTERLLDKMASADAQKQSVIIEQYVNKLANERNELNKLQQRKSGIEKNISEITEESNELRKAYHSPHKQLADWLRNDKDSIVDRIFKQMCEDNFDGDFPSGFPEKKAGIRTFKLHIAQLIDSLEICLLLDSTYLIEEPVTDLEIKNEYYREALSLLKKRIPFSTSYESKEKLRSYIDYLTERI